MKKLTAILLMLTMLFALPACDESTADTDDDKDTDKQVEKENADDKADADGDGEVSDEEIYDMAQAVMKEIKSSTAKMEMDMTMDLMGESFATTTNSTIYMDLEEQRVYTVSETEMNGETSASTMYYDPTVYMIETEGLKYKATMTEDTLSELMGENANSVDFNFSDFDSYVMTKTDDGYTFEVKGLKSDSALAGMLGESTTDLEGTEFDLSGIEMTVNIDKEYRFTSLALKMALDVDMGDLGSFTTSIDMTVEYSDFNNSADKVVKPDDTDYEELDLEEIIDL